MKKVLISTSSFGKEDSYPLEYIKSKADILLNPYGRTLTTEELTELVKDCDGLIAGTEKITRIALESAPRLKTISRCGVGLDNIDTQATQDLNIAVFNTPDAPTDAVAELAIALMLDISKKISFMDREMRSGIWKKRTGFLLKDKKVAIVGMGRIGVRVAKLLSAFDVKVKYFDIEPKEIDYEQEPDLKTLLSWADIVTLHCPAGKMPLLGKDELALMNNNTMIINTSRGKLIDENALYDALVSRHIKGAALDVYSEEPYKGELIGLDNVVLTPHIASSATECRYTMEVQAAENLAKGLGLDD